MRRTSIRILAAALLLGAATAAGFWAAARLGPEALRARLEVSLSRGLRTPVEVGRAQLSLGFGIAVEAWDLLAHTDFAASGLRARHASARIDPLPLLLGRVRLQSLRLDGVELRVALRPDGRWSPLDLWPDESAAASEPARPEPLLGAVEVIDGVARRLLSAPRLGRRLDIRDSRLVIAQPASPPDAGASAPAGAEPEPAAQWGEGALEFAIEGVAVRLRHRRLLGRSELEASGALVDAGAERGLLEVEGSRSRGGAARVSLVATRLDLAVLGPYAQTIHPDAALSGRLSGAVSCETAEPGHGRLRLDLLVSDLRATAPRLESQAFEPFQAESASLVADLEFRPGQLRIADARLRAGALDIGLEGAADRPLRPEAWARIALRFRDVELAQFGSLARWLPETPLSPLAPFAERLEAGRIASLEVRGSAPLARWRDLARASADQLPNDFAISAELANAVHRLPNGSVLSELSGRAEWRGDRISLSGVVARIDGRPLPALDLVVDGVSHLLAAPAARRLMPMAQGGLPGVAALWALTRPPEGEPETSDLFSPRVALEADYLRFHALLWPLERARAVLEPAYDGIDVSFERASWGGVPIRGRARWESGSFRAALAASPPEPPERAPEVGPGWGRGRLTIGPVSKGSWRFTGISARFQGEGDTIHLDDVSVALHPRGRALGSLALDLSQPDSVPLRASFAVRDGDVQELGEAIGVAPGFASGTVQMAGSFEGRLRPDAPLFSEISGLLSLDAREGRVHRKLPLVVAIATSEALNPFAGNRRSIRYDTAEVVLDFESGRVSSDAFVLRGPDMRVLAYGSLDLTDPVRQIDAVAAVFYQGKLDRMIGAIPLVNELLRGSDESLAAAYVKIEGPIDEPSVKMIPMKTFASLGPAGFVLEDVPNMLRSGLRALQSLFDSEADISEGQTPTSSLARPARRAS